MTDSTASTWDWLLFGSLPYSGLAFVVFGLLGRYRFYK